MGLGNAGTGISGGTIADWKYSFPMVDELASVAEFYGLSLDLIVFGKVNEDTGLKDDELNILEAYKMLNDTGKDTALIVVRGLVEKFPLPSEQAGASTGIAA